MRKIIISIAAAASALTIAAPASAQWVAPTYRYAPYNYGYGFNNGMNFARAMQSRVQRIRYDIHEMDRRGILSNREGRRLDNEARAVERRIYRAARYGITMREARTVESKIRQLEQHVAREARDWDRRPGRHRR
jgi:hypothetical protein